MCQHRESYFNLVNLIDWVMDEVSYEKIEILSIDNSLRKFHGETEKRKKDRVKFEEMYGEKKVF